MELIMQRSENKTDPYSNNVFSFGGASTEDTWVFRVPVSDEQAVVGFRKHGTIGVGFEVEEDWNTNLPAGCTPEKILQHIWHNHGSSLADHDHDEVLEAIKMIKAAAREGAGVGGWSYLELNF